MDDRFEELLGRHPRLLRTNQDREVLGHMAGFDRLDAHALERLGEVADIGRAVHASARGQPAGPREDRRDRVCRGRFTPLVLAEMARDGAVSGLGLDRIAIGGHEHAGHQPERAEPLRDGV